VHNEPDLHTSESDGLEMWSAAVIACTGVIVLASCWLWRTVRVHRRTRCDCLPPALIESIYVTSLPSACADRRNSERSGWEMAERVEACASGPTDHKCSQPSRTVFLHALFCFLLMEGPDREAGPTGSWPSHTSWQIFERSGQHQVAAFFDGLV
jgi:hypothetical protein